MRMITLHMKSMEVVKFPSKMTVEEVYTKANSSGNICVTGNNGRTIIVPIANIEYYEEITNENAMEN